ncbi:aminoglycoside phosphotransferase family protein [Streptomyces sp. RFCAC02]|uniref:aminoglycoside phosphotransferase family protein n=1 Tax=Streptomyces sp. RFCAC02 TaxID=2499143 RepID=UPI00102183C2|nr:aminoglycoside phosphotransferase family protein [Streptomyces sp. RFCAC02]
MTDIPKRLAEGTIAREGDAGRAWIAALPGLVDDLLERWGCVPDGPAVHGEVGIVVPVHRPGLGPAVLKVSFPHPGNAHEPDAYAVWDGGGAVRLHERDDERFAMLLERATPTTLASLEDPEEALTVAGDLARRLAVPAPPGLPRLRDLTDAWAAGLTADAESLSHPLPRHVVDAALAAYRDLGPGGPDTLVHGDLHERNVLRADREPWLVIDPKGYAGDPAYDAWTAVMGRAAALLGAADPRAALLRRIAVYCDAAGADRDRARRWAQARAVSSALWGRRHGDPAWVVEALDRASAALL